LVIDSYNLERAFGRQAVPDEEKQTGNEQKKMDRKRVALPFAGQRNLSQHETPSHPDPHKPIHARRPLPPVPEANPKDNSPDAQENSSE
jgi:hypothetical protein